MLDGPRIESRRIEGYDSGDPNEETERQLVVGGKLYSGNVVRDSWVEGVIDVVEPDNDAGNNWRLPAG